MFQNFRQLANSVSSVTSSVTSSVSSSVKGLVENTVNPHISVSRRAEKEAIPYSESENFKLFRAKYPKHTVKITCTDGNTWHYYDTGPFNKTPLVCIPGTSGTAEVFFQQILTLNLRGYRVISVSIAAVKTPQEFIRAFITLLNSHFGIDKPINLMGTSLGGYLALCFAEAYPECVKSMILCNSFCNTSYFHKNTPWVSTDYMPYFYLKRYVCAPLPKDVEQSIESALAVDFVLKQANALTHAELCSRVSLNVTEYKIKRILIPQKTITVIDPLDRVNLPEVMRAELYKLIPKCKYSPLKTGGDFPYLSEYQQFTMLVQVHLRRNGVHTDEFKGIASLYAQNVYKYDSVSILPPSTSAIQSQTQSNTIKTEFESKSEPLNNKEKKGTKQLYKVSNQDKMLESREQRKLPKGVFDESTEFDKQKRHLFLDGDSSDEIDIFSFNKLVLKSKSKKEKEKEKEKEKKKKKKKKKSNVDTSENSVNMDYNAHLDTHYPSSQSLTRPITEESKKTIFSQTMSEKKNENNSIRSKLQTPSSVWGVSSTLRSIHEKTSDDIRKNPMLSATNLDVIQQSRQKEKEAKSLNVNSNVIRNAKDDIARLMNRGSAIDNTLTANTKISMNHSGTQYNFSKRRKHHHGAKHKRNQRKKKKHKQKKHRYDYVGEDYGHEASNNNSMLSKSRNVTQYDKVANLKTMTMTSEDLRFKPSEIIDADDGGILVPVDGGGMVPMPIDTTNSVNKSNDNNSTVPKSHESMDSLGFNDDGELIDLNRAKTPLLRIAGRESAFDFDEHTEVLQVFQGNSIDFNEQYNSIFGTEVDANDYDEIFA